MYDLENMTEDEAATAVREIFAKFDFAGAFFDRSDVESWMDRRISDEEFTRVINTPQWSGVQDLMTSSAWDSLGDACKDAGLDPDTMTE